MDHLFGSVLLSNQCNGVKIFSTFIWTEAGCGSGGAAVVHVGRWDADQTKNRQKGFLSLCVVFITLMHVAGRWARLCSSTGRQLEVTVHCSPHVSTVSTNPQIVFLFWFPLGLILNVAHMLSLSTCAMMYRELQLRAHVFFWQLSVSLTPSHLPSFLLTWAESTFTCLGLIHLHPSALTASRLTVCFCVSVAFVTYLKHFWHKRWICWNQLSSWGPKTNRNVVGVWTTVWVEVRSGLKLDWVWIWLGYILGLGCTQWMEIDAMS